MGGEATLTGTAHPQAFRLATFLVTAALFLEEGLERVVPSFDLNWEQFSGLVSHCDPSRLEAGT